jgi:hypothetical protein
MALALWLRSGFNARNAAIGDSQQDTRLPAGLEQRFFKPK